MPKIDPDPQWLDRVEQLEKECMKLLDHLRFDFTLWWEGLPSSIKSLLITGGGIVLATVILKLAQIVFPGADFAAEQTIILGAISGFIISLAKDGIKKN